MARTPLTTVSARIAEPRPETGRRPTISLLVTSLRPEQWTKNLLLFAGVIFGGRLLEVSAVLTAGAAFVIFCALSGSVYLFNDLWAREADRHHPLKQKRPIAAVALVTVLLRYLYLVHEKRRGGSPALATARPLLACVVLWVGTVAVLLYSPLGN